MLSNLFNRCYKAVIEESGFCAAYAASGGWKGDPAMLASSTLALALAFAGYFMMRDRFYDNRSRAVLATLAFTAMQLAKLPKICEELIETEVIDNFPGM